MDRVGFWSRMGQWFRGLRGTPNGADAQEAYAEPSQSSELNAGEQDRSPGELARYGGNRSAGGRSGLRSGGGGLERLEQEYTRVVHLIESVQKNLERQTERSEQVAEAMTRLADALAQVPETSRTQVDLLAKLNEQATAEAASARNIEQALSQLPRIADGQRETMVGIGRQLDATRETTERVAGSLDGFKEGLNQVAEATSATGRALEKTRWDASARDERIATILQEQTKRLTMFAVAAICLAAVAALGSVIAMFF